MVSKRILSLQQSCRLIFTFHFVTFLGIDFLIKTEIGVQAYFLSDSGLVVLV